MANVDRQQSRLALDLIAYLEEEWDRAPGIIDSWPRLSSEERAAIALDWRGNEVTPGHLQSLLDSGKAGQEAPARFRALSERITTLRPALAALFAEDGAVRASA